MARTPKRAAAARDRIAAQNRKARRDYIIEDTVEAGLILTGSEVKGLRGGGANLNDSYAREQGGELWLINAHIPPYKFAGVGAHESRRRRKLLLHRRELNRLIGAIQRDGMTAVPLSIYFSDRGIAKVELGLAKGRRKYEKRELVKQRDWQRQKARLMRQRD
ncbi:MAG: SsrA-binding protein SmpB [Alphaproteobacteria bacterium]|nr:SsrA-binding protein SmpB [Pseudomonadota bacterium]TDI63714.1 MAG: SsrA-binding protein SmpB [Alphaproteobacteria bacterium]